MLRSLHIRNYVLIDSLDIRFPEGLVIITGQTGAGKSILIGALGLLAGEKADASLVAEGADTCVVEGEFDTPEGLRIIRRVLYSSGRSRSFIDDCPVQLQELSELCSHLIDIHSQHRSLLLTDKSFQLSLLDHFTGNDALLEQCRGSWKTMCEVRRELQEAQEKLRGSLEGRDYSEAQFRELEAARLRSGELEELEEEQKALANAEEIKERLCAALSCYSPDGAESMAGSLLEARKQLSHAARYLPAMEQLGERINSARLELEDIFGEVASAADGVDVSGERLEAVEERLSLLYRLLKKHGCKDIDALIATRESYGAELFGTEDLQEQCSALEKRLSALEKEHSGLCEQLHSARQKASREFAASVESHLHFLELERASFGVELSPSAPGAGGADSVTFLFSADGGPGADVAKCASGGEMSRIMLSLKAMMASFKGMPTLIFDEIDSGVSGSVASKMGSMICEMGKTMQVFSITHLPQVAAKGRAHYVVSKRFDQERQRSVTGIAAAEGEDRVREIARLLSGESITPEALANARALMQEKH